MIKDDELLYSRGLAGAELAPVCEAAWKGGEGIGKGDDDLLGPLSGC